MICAAVPIAATRAPRRATTAATTAQEGVLDRAPGAAVAPAAADVRATATAAKGDCGVFRAMGAADAEDVAAVVDALAIAKVPARAVPPAVPTATPVAM